MTDQAGNRDISIKWLVGVLVAFVAFAGGQIITDFKKNVDKVIYATECLAKDKVEKSDYIRDMGEIKAGLLRIESKLETVRK